MADTHPPSSQEMPQTEPVAPPSVSRRKALGVVVVGLGAGIGLESLAWTFRRDLRHAGVYVHARPSGLAAFPPPIVMVVPAAEMADLREMPQRRDVAVPKADGFRVREETHTVYVAKHGGTYLALSAICPHSGCTVSFDAKDKEAPFKCPCHHATFDSRGRVLSGPSPRDLDSLVTFGNAGNGLMCQLSRYRLNVKEKQELM
jgi:Rieske Fe-S protein